MVIERWVETVADVPADTPIAELKVHMENSTPRIPSNDHGIK